MSFVNNSDYRDIESGDDSSLRKIEQLLAERRACAVAAYEELKRYCRLLPYHIVFHIFEFYEKIIMGNVLHEAPDDKSLVGRFVGDSERVPVCIYKTITIRSKIDHTRRNGMFGARIHAVTNDPRLHPHYAFAFCRARHLCVKFFIHTGMIASVFDAVNRGFMPQLCTLCVAYDQVRQFAERLPGFPEIGHYTTGYPISISILFRDINRRKRDGVGSGRGPSFSNYMLYTFFDGVVSKLTTEAKRRVRSAGITKRNEHVLDCADVLESVSFSRLHVYGPCDREYAETLLARTRSLRFASVRTACADGAFPSHALPATVTRLFIEADMSDARSSEFDIRHLVHLRRLDVSVQPTNCSSAAVDAFRRIAPWLAERGVRVSIYT